MTNRSREPLIFPGCKGSQVEADFAGGNLTSGAGVLLVRYLRPANIDGAKHAWAILALLVKPLRREWPNARIIFRGDSGFCRWRMLRWCDRQGVFSIVGLAKNKRINEQAARQIDQAR